ncbi:hypothetical protein MXD81_18320, partial [Microbacteriaceae bacterium K1510]|nr:hypothetical protein [Microbacteriaceae bacterium K1510]
MQSNIGKGYYIRIGVIALLAVWVVGCGRTGPQERSIGTRSIDPQQYATIVNDRNHDTIDREAPKIEDRDYL